MNNLEKTGIYTITNTFTNKVYVGSTSTSFKQRFREHKKLLKKEKHFNNYLQNSWSKYGESRFVFDILDIYEPDLCRPMEQYWINVINPEYNIQKTVGRSNLGVKKTLEQRIMQSKRLGGRPFEVWKEDKLIGIFHTQSQCSEELNILQCKVLKCLHGQARHTKGYRFKYIGEDFVFYPKKRYYSNRPSHSQETKDKMSKSHKGKRVSEKTRTKISETAKKLYKSGKKKPYKRNWSEEDRLNFSRLKTSGILQVYTKEDVFVEEFLSMNEMCKKYKLCPSNVHHVLNGNRKSHKGYKFKRINRG